MSASEDTKAFHWAKEKITPALYWQFIIFVYLNKWMKQTPCSLSKITAIAVVTSVYSFGKYKDEREKETLDTGFLYRRQ